MKAVESPRFPERVALLPAISAEQLAQVEATALKANDEYLIDIVEKHAFCPFSREGRRRGETVRYVHWADSSDLEPVVQLMLKVAEDESLAVAQVIFPGLQITPSDWLELTTAITRHAHRRRGETDVLALAALHPELPFTDENPFSLVPLFRRSPDPTIQWVRLSSLDALYKGREKGSQFVDPADIMKVLDEPAPKPLYDRVAETNRAMAKRLGPDVLVEHLEAIRQRAQAAYAGIVGA